MTTPSALGAEFWYPVFVLVPSRVFVNDVMKFDFLRDEIIQLSHDRSADALVEQQSPDGVTHAALVGLKWSANW